ncbi:NAD(P)-dependent oxidoreductase [Actinacidiphila acidipaludis]|uniref:NAD(P)H-binding protein n=1 Tax=Actinacidiphila acidipaludis TaxID=2873382 RepID=A0ABS7QE29_9ACTN|nr:NAD(P)H-binding protein [Streptomyces acidipaludis]MBY8880680.1 NAD(P)H-binding protein [Streptomyces acidipaludis]
MRIAILGASGKTGHATVEQALARGHQVVALVRRPEVFTVRDPSAHDRVEVRRADVTSPADFPDLSDVDVVVSALGVSKGDGPGALEAGAKVLTARRVRAIWLGALGSGVSTGAGGAIYQAVMRMFVGRELAEKAAADHIALAGGTTVFHAPDVANGPVSPNRRILRLADYRRPFLPPRITRDTLAALLIDEAEAPTHRAEVLVPLG